MTKKSTIMHIDIEIKGYEELLAKTQDNYYHNSKTEDDSQLLSEINLLTSFINTLKKVKTTVDNNFK